MSYIQISDTLSTEEFIQRRGKENIDTIFEEAIKTAKQEELQKMQSEEHEKHIISLVTRLSDLEAEVSIVEQLYLKSLGKADMLLDDKMKYKKDLASLRRQYSKIKNELDNLLLKESNITNK